MYVFCYHISGENNKVVCYEAMYGDRPIGYHPLSRRQAYFWRQTKTENGNSTYTAQDCSSLLVQLAGHA